LVTLVFVYTLFFGLQKTRGSQEEILQKQEKNAQATATQKPQTQILQIAQSKTKEESKNIPT
jgi:hypothetical protein